MSNTVNRWCHRRGRTGGGGRGDSTEKTERGNVPNSHRVWGTGTTHDSGTPGSMRIDLASASDPDIRWMTWSECPSGSRSIATMI